MEITINIPKNEFQKPTEIRQEVVQGICDYIIKGIKKNCWGEGTMRITLEHNDWVYVLYLDTFDNGIRMVSPYTRGGVEQTRIHGVEMQAAFDALQDAGYYIYSCMFTTGEHRYTFTTKPVYDGRRAERMNFTEFID